MFLVSAGLSVSLGLMGFANLAHGALYMLGAYIGISAAGITGYWGALFLAPVAVGAIGAALYLGLLSRVTSGGSMAQVLISFGLIFVTVELVRIVWGDVALTLDPPDVLSGQLHILGISYPAYRLFIIITGAITLLALWLTVTQTNIGTALRASAENPAMARAMGVRTKRLFTLTFTFGAGLAGMAGIIAAPILSASPVMAVNILIPALIVTVVGGTGSITGTASGALIVATAETMGAALWPDISAISTYVVLAIILIRRPEGLLTTDRSH